VIEVEELLNLWPRIFIANEIYAGSYSNMYLFIWLRVLNTSAFCLAGTSVLLLRIFKKVVSPISVVRCGSYHRHLLVWF